MGLYNHFDRLSCLLVFLSCGARDIFSTVVLSLPIQNGVIIANALHNSSMAVVDDKTKGEQVEAVVKTPDSRSDTEGSTPHGVDNGARPHITFKTKMALLVGFTL